MLQDIIGVTGHSRNGKDSFAAVLVEEFGYQRFALADNVRRSVYALNPWVVLESPTVLSTVGPLRVQLLVDTFGWGAAKADPAVRGYLQRMGTEAGRDILGDDVWIRALRKQIDESGAERVVVTDCRFPNECEAIRSWGGAVVRVRRQNLDGSQYQNPAIDPSHASEALVDQLSVDHDFVATSLAELQQFARIFASVRVGVLDWLLPK